MTARCPGRRVLVAERPIRHRCGRLRGTLSLGGLAEDIRDNEAALAARPTSTGLSLAESPA